ncbi:Histone-lysine N-methyltransferase SETMAR-like [Oopsacas minuta]|uniref:Histone-lysine N-methyltransferase SETMAR-like n=1 Tax=Oopsacas minuta TaxID=111878 RepID=A0AAV7JBV3_9METZ|nr:Histone-lysine N-methyltransferase SETMAR-like [Oopsacas minuta]
MQDIFGDECPSKATIYRWIERFDNGDKVRHDDPLPGCATSSKTRRNIEEDRRITLRELEERVGISKATLHSIITEDLEMSKGKTQSKQWKGRDELVHIKVKAAKSAGKRVTTVLWDREGIIHLDWLPEKTTMNSDYYVDELNELRQANKRERREKVNTWRTAAT